MRLPKSILDNLHFLLAETQSQVNNLQVLLETASPSIAQRILDRQGYSYNLKMRIHDGCVETLAKRKKGSIDIFSLRAGEAIATNMERISDVCHDCVALMRNLKRHDALTKGRNAILIKDVIRGLRLIEKAIDNDDARLALRIGDIERKLDRAYARLFKSHVRQMGQKKNQPEDTMVSLIIAQRIEEMGDILLDSSEAIVSAKLGQPMHLQRFKSLENTLSDLGLIDPEVRSIAETKSGSGISSISGTNKKDNDYVAIFKDGRKDKLKEERESVESWHEIYPGLAPQILSYKKQGKHASLLIEHLPGRTFEQCLLQADQTEFEKALKQLSKTLRSVWRETKRKKQPRANHMGQLNKRLSSVFEVHPQFNRPAQKVATHSLTSLNKLVAQTKELEDSLDAPFSVYIHGDFNLDNIIFDTDNNKIRFVDLHRSCYQDYVQDISVFMVSNYRLQVFQTETRKRIRQSALHMYKFARDFARKNGDETFELRLAIGLARSFITSTRFILDSGLAKAMFLRGLYIMESLAQLTPAKAAKYKPPIKDLFQ